MILSFFLLQIIKYICTIYIYYDIINHYWENKYQTDFWLRVQLQVHVHTCMSLFPKVINTSWNWINMKIVFQQKGRKLVLKSVCHETQHKIILLEWITCTHSNKHYLKILIDDIFFTKFLKIFVLWCN